MVTPAPWLSVFASTWKTLEALPIWTVSAASTVPCALTRFFPRRRRAPGLFTPTLAETLASLLIFPSRAARKGSPGHWQTGDVVGGVVVVVVDVVDVVLVPQPWTRKFTPSA